jgi:hypothetical protein
MSTISNDPNSYQTYQKQYTDFEDSTRAEEKRQHQHEEDRVASLEKRQSENLRKQENDYSKTIGDVKKNDGETLTQERKTARQEMEQSKREMYDRYGRFADGESSAYKRQIEDMQRSHDARENQVSEQLRLADEHAQHSVESIDQKTREASEAAMTRMRENFSNDQVNARNQDLASRQELVDGHQKRLSELTRDHNLDFQTQQRQTEKALDALQTDSARRVDQAKVAYEKSTARQEREIANTKTSDANKLRESHAEETRDLRNQIHNLVAEEGTYMKERGQGTQDAVREYDNRWNDRLKAQTDSFSAQLADQKDQAHREEIYLDHSSNDALKAKDRFYAGVMNKQNLDDHNAQADDQAQFARNLNDVTKAAQKERATNQTIYENQMKGLSEHNHDVMAQQAKTFQGTEAQHEEHNKLEIDRLQRALQEKSTTADTSQISPAAESNLRKQVAREYGKIQQADQDRFERRFEKLDSDYRDRYMDLSEKSASKETQINRTIASERQQDRNEFVTHIAETEEGKNMAMASQQQQHDREADLMNRNYSRLLGRKSQEHENALSVTRDDAANRIAEIRQEADFNSKMAQRSFSVRQNELIRDYEKKLADQKSEYDGRLDDVKAQSQVTTRDVERKLKNELDTQTRASDQRLAQLDATYKERERYLTQNFQDEIEKVKRQNALLIQKKS